MKSRSQSFSVQGYWWAADDPKRKWPGVLRFDRSSGASLELTGRFVNTSAFRPANVGAEATAGASVVLGTTLDGVPMSLMNAVEGARSTSRYRTPREKTHATYRSYLLVRGGHVRAWEALSFVSLSLAMPGLQRCIGTTGFVHEKKHIEKVERVTYRRPRDLTLAIGGFNVTVKHWSWMDYGQQSRQISEDVAVIISSSQPKHYADYTDGPVHTLRTLAEFIGSRPISIENLSGQLPQAHRTSTRGFVDLLYARGVDDEAHDTSQLPRQRPRSSPATGARARSCRFRALGCYRKLLFSRRLRRGKRAILLRPLTR